MGGKLACKAHEGRSDQGQSEGQRRRCTPSPTCTLYNEDSNDSSSIEDRGMSREDRLWVELVNSSCSRKENGQYEIALPFRESDPVLPNNRNVAVKRLNSLRRKPIADSKLHKDYTSFMSDMLEKGYAEEAHEDARGTDGNMWYIPHHSVRHAQKPDKVRVVFDCASKFHGVSLNSMLLQSPYLTSNLADVLMRFREAPVAFIADIEPMIYQGKVPSKDRDSEILVMAERRSVATTGRVQDDCALV